MSELALGITLAAAERRAVLERLRTQFYGLDAEYARADGTTGRRIYLDSAASNLPMKASADVVRRALAHYANTHSQLHFGARIMTHLFHEAHETVLRFVGADDTYTAVFTGSGVTGCLNRMARVLAQRRPERDTVITTVMEHHANDLPHRKHVGRVVHVPVEKDLDGEAGRVNMEALRHAIEAEKDRLNYVAITAASNVTGVTNPIHEIARMAHKAGALMVVDAAQSAAHQALSIVGDDEASSFDVLVLSGHKIYTPGSPGVIMARKSLFEGLEPQEIGGGVVTFVDAAQYMITDALPDREETGTPNIPGAIGLAATLKVLMHVGMDLVEEDEREITQYALTKFEALPNVHLYGSHRLEVAERIGVVTFNVAGLEHGLVAAALNDYYGIAVRNECFCAQPFVRQLLGNADDEGVAAPYCLERRADPASPKPGMVRVSFGLYNTKADVDAVVAAVRHISENPEYYRSQYEPVLNGSGDWRHRTFHFDPTAVFDLDVEIDAWLDRLH